jgi:multidrug efflux pump subunit AcrA (membrane-fusion protein)
MKRFFAYLSIAFIFYGCGEKESISPIKKDIQEVVFASGIMEMENQYVISAKVDGFLAQISSREGDSVRLNETIATLDSDVQEGQLKEIRIQLKDAKKNAASSSPQLQNLKSQIDQAQEQLFFDEEQYRKYKDLWEQKTVSQVDFEKKKLQYELSKSNLKSLQENYKELESSLQLSVQNNLAKLNTQQAVLKDYNLKTKVAGVILNVYKKQGELVRRGEEVLKIGSGDYILKLFISEEDITKIQLNQTVVVSMNTYLEKTFTAKVTKIYPGFNEKEQSYIIEAKFIELPNKLFSGTQLQANIKIAEREQVLLIPTSYLKANMVKLENGDMQTIDIGFSNTEWTEVKSGISESDVIVKQ